jgi:hypothetical protein
MSMSVAALAIPRAAPGSMSPSTLAVVVPVPPRTILLLSPSGPVLVSTVFCFCLDGLVNICFMRFLSQWGQIRIIFSSLRHGQTHGSQHGILLSLFQLALLFLDALSLCFLGAGVALCIPVQIAALLPAADWGHERVAQVVFALRIAFDIFPLEVGAAATAIR